ncbi:MAG: glycosyltransferase [Erysipelotrichia bacterium]|nr:glycosyltransferase [Erysipelotrichia bacterium]
MNSQLLRILQSYKKVLIIGPLPPPLGGISVHVYRLHKALENSQVFDLSQKQDFKGQSYIKIFNLLKNKEFDAVHVHAYDVKLIVTLKLLKIFKNFDIIATSHNPRLFETDSVIKKYFFKSFFKFIDTLVVVGSHVLEDYRVRGIKLPEEIIVENAFLPPPLEEEKRILDTYSKELFDFIDIHTHIITANAFQISFHNSVELYGLDMCIELTSKLKKDFPNIGFVFALANENVNIDYLNKMKQKIKELETEDNFYFLTGQKELWPLFKKIDLMIRPTTTDGDALSIREAMYLGCTAIASDVSDRPEGTIMFKSRDLEELYMKTKKVLDAKN